MALKKLSNDVQSLLCASSQVNSFKRAIEELIYNSLDAGSTSIAIRIHIQESTIQVIDNGHGITKTDFHLIGQRYMTSKTMDVATMKAAPKNYGYRGEFLANVIAVSQMVKVTSRHESSEDTWAKIFSNGKEKKLIKMTTRPTKGTTVDIKGFLYNLNIQKRGIDPVNELQNIKMFLEQLSLVHNHISLSIRDDLQNEIVFKIHKKRNIYQTLSNVFNIDKSDVQELQVEKNEYKVKGLIGKGNNELDLHWIYVNGKFIHNSSKLHKITNEYFKKCLNIKEQTRLKSKRHDESQLFNQNIPYYIIFVTCPYIDYDIDYATKQAIIQFKNWDQLNKMLEKLVKFFVGDVNLKEVKNVEKIVSNADKENNDTRDQVKKIIDKILGNNSKKLGISQLQNGIKGKLVKRKNKKKTTGSVNVQRLLFKKETNTNFDDKCQLMSNILPNLNHNAPQQVKEKADNKDKLTVHKVRESPNHCRKRKKIPKQKKHPIKEIPRPNKRIKDLTSPVLQMNQNNAFPKIKNNTMKQKQLPKNKNKIKSNKHELHYLKNTDSVYKRSKIVAQEAEEFLRNNNITKIKPNINYYEEKKNPLLLKSKYCAINEYEQPINKVNYQYLMSKLKTKPYKTTYDLLQTIMNSQKLILNTVESNKSEELDKALYRKRDIQLHFPKLSKRYITNKFICNEYPDVDGKNINEISLFRSNIKEQHTPYHYGDNFNEILSFYRENEGNTPQIAQRFQLTDTFNCYQKYAMQKETSHPVTNALSLLTYDSHKYRNNEAFERNETENCCTINRKPNIRFITKQSKDNFATSDDLRVKFKRPRKIISNRQTKTYDVRRIQSITESLYTIEYSKSSENNFGVAENEIVSMNMNYENIDDCYKNQGKNICDDAFAMIDEAFGNTYTLNSFHVNIATQNSRNKTQKKCESNQLLGLYDSRNEVNGVHSQPKNNCTTNKNNTNFVFVSKSQCSTNAKEPECSNMIVEPLDVCETVLRDIGSGEREFDFTFNENHQRNDSLYNISPNIKIVNEHQNQDCLINLNKAVNNNGEDVSHHFNNLIQATENKQMNDNYNIDNNIQDQELLEKSQPRPINKNVIINDSTDINVIDNMNVKQDCNVEIDNFNLRNRPRFVPKGMSQIFENCRSKTACDYNIDKDYYEDSIYNNFVNDVQANTEIYEPMIQNVEELATKNVHKFQTKVKKDHASLVFDENSLKNAAVLGQVDCKFIAAVMENHCVEQTETSQYLMLFDQHAVHERIRLEKNLADYIIDDKWTSVTVDNMILKMSKDEILYLHNYKDKFNQLGLFWTISDANEVIVHSIPEAIIGKNPREVDKVIKAVRNMIVEEISAIKLQKGCMSLYPKSIMDLVFSEACRYAIKFGDQLPKNDCVELINGLSNCKTPFQCAHGRPVMAVIMDIKEDNREYKVNMEQLKRFKKIN
ncbi:unnamed protein product [Spodoptera littoralis]|uniref:MutL C-terminal dimerisation domain-containing protein n=1 Tax=Spodoptera littoralis TaxID=7109 RepID=A0A9P0MWA6_SPOLI|nr:unnamed protein product [Spodoptera littoralis]CAH1635731.1 unnamed protein product [Spodoptera littoralis]